MFPLRVVVLVVIFSLTFSPLTPLLAQEVSDSTSISVGETSSQVPLPVDTEMATSHESLQAILPEINPDIEQTTDSEVVVDELSKDGTEKETTLQPSAGNSATASLASNSDSGKVIRPNIDQSTGALIYDYPMETPNGFNQQNPNLKLTYNSQDVKNDSVFGYGWNVSIPYIERVNKHGVNDFYSGDGIDFASSVFGELVQKTTTTYVPKSASDIVLISFVNNVWTYIDKEGTTYVYGLTSAGRQDDPSNSAHIYKWMLTSVTDSNGNSISYTYTKDQGQIYPDTVNYGGYIRLLL